MSPDIYTGKQRPDLLQYLYHLRQYFILYRFVWHVIGAFQLNTDGKVITVLPSAEFGTAGVPGAPVKRHELYDLSFPVYQKMCGNLQVLDLLEIRMRVRIERIAEQLLNAGTAELPRRQTDTMDDQQAYIDPFRPVIIIR